FKGTVSGEITHARQGTHGFGYDPIFFVPDKKRTMAELTDEEKSEISHRGNAIQLLKAYLEGGQNE
ncbi:non-canonical purine NTP pyrophosphatase, partial [Staphylococcus aureus]|nr:non-canonical purine NTP pyrophosphatase [Staphylococcus aureus]